MKYFVQAVLVYVAAAGVAALFSCVVAYKMVR